MAQIDERLKDASRPSGDLIVSPIPYAHGSYMTDWIAANRRLAALDAAVIIPGHGKILRDREYLPTRKPAAKSSAPTPTRTE